MTAGKPKKSTKDGAPLFIRLTVEERQALQRRAAAAGMKPVQYVRRLIERNLRGDESR